MSGFERIKEEKKTRIREAAFQLFVENGYKNVKISDIAKAADVSQVTIYNHFESKEALFRDLMIRFTEKKYLEYEEVIQSDKPFKEKLEFVFKDKMEIGRLLNPELLERILTGDPILSEYLQKYSEEKGYPIVLKLIDEGKKDGMVNQNVSMKSILFFLNMFEDASRKYPDLFAGEDRLSLMEDAFNLIFYGLIGKAKE
jgi:AcrR family transcriptional regulator